jgi:hypothetical protein
MQVYCIREQHRTPSEYLKELKLKSEEILALFLRALLEAESTSFSTQATQNTWGKNQSKKLRTGRNCRVKSSPTSQSRRRSFPMTRSLPRRC